MRVLKLIRKNSGRHLLRTSLTILGMAIAVMAFAVIRTALDAWYAQAEASSPNRLVVTSAISLTFTLPMAYETKIRSIEGVTNVSYAQWFNGTYIDTKNFFPRFAVDHTTYFDMYPEYIIPPDEKADFFRERNACMIGKRLADRFGLKLGDPMHLTGDIFPGDWDFVIRAIFTGAKENTDEGVMFFRFDYLDERMREEAPARAGQVGSFIVQIADPSQAAAISEKIDAMFKNSLAETKTQTEEAFSLSFVALASSIVMGLKVISILVIGIILMVLANTMAMTARERVAEYAVMKTLGFRAFHIIGLIFGESLLIACLGGVLGILFTFPVVGLMKAALSDFFGVFPLRLVTLLLAGTTSLVVGFTAAVFPTIKALRTSIVDGLRIVD
ncbi:MAG TPA: FtsX-like permease family protein [Candidatus Acidoferrum sp.]|nr:FtsX-like permease family protein [Candidatus Acidoferrum sp.]